MTAAVCQGTWTAVCRVTQLRMDGGVAALVDDQQVAIFLLGQDDVRAIGNLDPFSGANVLSRGIVGSRGEAVFVSSPMYKQPFDLSTGVCLDDASVSVPTYAVRLVDDVVQILSPAEQRPGENRPGENLPGENFPGVGRSGEQVSGERAGG